MVVLIFAVLFNDWLMGVKSVKSAFKAGDLNVRTRTKLDWGKTTTAIAEFSWVISAGNRLGLDLNRGAQLTA